MVGERECLNKVVRIGGIRPAKSCPEGEREGRREEGSGRNEEKAEGEIFSWHHKRAREGEVEGIRDLFFLSPKGVGESERASEEVEEEEEEEEEEWSRRKQKRRRNVRALQGFFFGGRREGEGKNFPLFWSSGGSGEWRWRRN